MYLFVIGILCGECSNNGSTGVSILLNNCASCDDGFSTLIPLLSKSMVKQFDYFKDIFSSTVIADIIAFIVILVLSLPFPSWLIPAIFYIQVRVYKYLVSCTHIFFLPLVASSLN